MSFDDKGLIAVIGAALLSWATWITRKCSKAMSYSAHKTICESRDAEIKELLAKQDERSDERFDKLEAMLQKQGTDANIARNRIANRVQTMSNRVAVLVDRSVREHGPIKIEDTNEIERLDAAAADDDPAG